VVEFLSIWDWPDEQFVGHSMRKPVALPTTAEIPIAVAVHTVQPEPA